MFVSQEVLIGLAVVSVGVAGYIYKKQQPPSHNEIQSHIDAASDLYAKHESKLEDAKAAADAHVEAKQAQIDALSKGIVTAQSSIAQAQTLVAGL